MKGFWINLRDWQRMKRTEKMKGITTKSLVHKHRAGRIWTKFVTGKLQHNQFHILNLLLNFYSIKRFAQITILPFIFSNMFLSWLSFKIVPSIKPYITLVFKFLPILHMCLHIVYKRDITVKRMVVTPPSLPWQSKEEAISLNLKPSYINQTASYFWY